MKTYKKWGNRTLQKILSFAAFYMTGVISFAYASITCSVTPDSGTFRQESPATFTATYTDTKGTNDIYEAYIAFGSDDNPEAYLSFQWINTNAKYGNYYELEYGLLGEYYRQGDSTGEMVTIYSGDMHYSDVDGDGHIDLNESEAGNHHMDISGYWTNYGAFDYASSSKIVDNNVLNDPQNRFVKYSYIYHFGYVGSAYPSDSDKIQYSPDGKTLAIKWGAVFAKLAPETMNVYLRVVDSAKGDTGWIKKGTINTPAHDPDNVLLTASPSVIKQNDLERWNDAYSQYENDEFQTITAVYKDLEASDAPEVCAILISKTPVIKKKDCLYAVKKSTGTVHVYDSFFYPGGLKDWDALEEQYDDINCLHVTYSGDSQVNDLGMVDEAYADYIVNNNKTTMIKDEQSGCTTVQWSIAAKRGIPGLRNVYLKSIDEHGGWSSWKKVGTWEVPNVAPNKEGSTQYFVKGRPKEKKSMGFITYEDKNDWTDLRYCHLYIKADGEEGFHAYYDQNENKIWAYENGVAIGGYAPRSANIITTTTGIIDCADICVGGGNCNDSSYCQLGIQWVVTPTGKLVGEKKIILESIDDSGLRSGEWTAGTFTVINSTPTIETMYPLNSHSAPGEEVVYTACYEDGDGLDDIRYSYLNILDTTSGSTVLSVYYDNVDGKIYTADGSVSYKIGSSNTIETAGAVLNCKNSKKVTALSTTSHAIYWAVAFKDAVNGHNLSLQLKATDAAETTSGFVTMGTWQVYNLPSAGAISPSYGVSKANERFSITASCSYSGRIYLMFQNPGDESNPNDSMANRYVVYYDMSNKLLYAVNDFNEKVGGYAPGSNNVIETPRGKLYCADTTVSTTDSDVKVTWSLSFSDTFAGQKNVCIGYPHPSDQTYVIYKAKGEWIIGSKPVATYVGSSPTLNSSRVGDWTTFSVTYRDEDGVSNLDTCGFMVNIVGNQSDHGIACYYMPNTGEFAVTGDTSKPATLTNNIYEIQQAKLDLNKTKVTKVNATTIKIDWVISFNESATWETADTRYKGTGVLAMKNLYVSVSDKSTLGSIDGWVNVRNWQVLNNKAPQVLSVVSVPEANASVPETYVTFVSRVSDADGINDIVKFYFMVNSDSTNMANGFVGMCSMQSAAMLNDEGTGLAAYKNNTYENSFAKLDMSGTKVTQIDDNTLEVQWRVCFKSSLIGNKTVYLAAYDKANIDVVYKTLIEPIQWVDIGPWTIASNLPPTAVSVVPVPAGTVSKVGKWVTFSATYTDPNETADLAKCMFRIGASTSSNASCLDAYLDENGFVHMFDDSGTQSAGLSNGIYENSYAKLDMVKTVVTRVDANTLKIDWRVAFKSTYIGTYNMFIAAVDKQAQGGTWVDCGKWKVVANSAPVAVSAVSVPAATSSKQKQWVVFETTYSDVDGVEDLTSCTFLIASSASRSTACFEGRYDPATGSIYMTAYPDSDTPAALNNNVYENTYAKLDMNNTYVTKIDQNTIKIKWRVCLKELCTGASYLYQTVVDTDNAGSGKFVYKGKWTILNQYADNAPTVTALSAGKAVVAKDEVVSITSSFSDADNAGDIAACWMVVKLNEPPMLFSVTYDNVNNLLIMDDDNGGTISAKPGSMTVLSNSKVKLYCEGTTATFTDTNTLTIVWKVSFSEEMLGLLDISSMCEDNEYLWAQNSPEIKIEVSDKAFQSAPLVNSFTGTAVNGSVIPYENCTFNMSFSDANGLSDMKECGININFSGKSEGVSVVYNIASGDILLKGSGEVDRSYSGSSAAFHGKYAGNLYAELDCENTNVSVTQDSSTGVVNMSVTIAFTKNFTGKKDINAFVTDSSETVTAQEGNVTVLVPGLFVDLDSDQSQEIVVNNSLSSGLMSIKKGSSKSTNLNGVTPDIIIKAQAVKAGMDNLVVDFGDPYGIWMLLSDGSWRSIHRTSPEAMVAADVNGDGLDEIVMDFGGMGVWTYFPNGTWALVHNGNSRHISKGDVDNDGKDELIMDFGARYGIWIYHYGDTVPWTFLHSASCDNIVTADSDSDGYDEITIDFGEKYGLWRVTLNPSVPAVKTWQYLHWADPKIMGTCDIDGDGRNDIFVDFRNEVSGLDYGIYSLDGKSGWSGDNLVLYWDIVHTSPAFSLSAGAYDTASKGDELLVDFGPSYKKWMKNVYNTVSCVSEWLCVN